ncbi:hypothetical protein [Nonomuraea sp. LPB2021202275-12-8]|uniref:hypothetical protein n=1 Tax=Nonomuraea sp. LPB2021202275-12-8 TaxID=3120159 RepID=UPI00300D55C3
MSHKRSGLLPGLMIGFLAMLLGTAGVGAGIFFTPWLPRSLHTFADGIPFVIGLSVVAGLLVVQAMVLVRPGARTLPPMAALYAGAATALGLTAGRAAQDARFPPVDQLPQGTAASYPGLTLDTFVEAVPAAAALFRDPLEVSWLAWTSVAAAALVALTLVTLRVRRVRRLGAATTDPAKAVEEEEPEYRAPFEPLQTSKPASRPTGSLFLPQDRDPA